MQPEPMAEKIAVCMNDGRRTRQEVEPIWQRGVWAVHKAPGRRGEHDDPIWLVTHVPSGSCLEGVEEPMRRAMGLGLVLFGLVPDIQSDAGWGQPFKMPDDVVRQAGEWLLAARAEARASS